MIITLIPPNNQTVPFESIVAEAPNLLFIHSKKNKKMFIIIRNYIKYDYNYYYLRLRV